MSGATRQAGYYRHKVSYETMRDLITNCPNPNAQLLGAFLYGGMARISEITGKNGVRPTDITLANNKLFMELNNEKQVKKEARKTIVINMEREPWLVELILSHVRGKPLSQNLFPYSRVSGWKLIKQYFKFHPHYFRRARANHYLKGEVTGKPASVEVVRRLGGWSSARTMMQEYSDVTVEDIMDFV